VRTQKFFPHQAIDGEWHVVYRAATGGLVSVCAGFPDKAVAGSDAERLNKAAERCN